MFKLFLEDLKKVIISINLLLTNKIYNYIIALNKTRNDFFISFCKVIF